MKTLYLICFIIIFLTSPAWSQNSGAGAVRETNEEVFYVVDPESGEVETNLDVQPSFMDGGFREFHHWVMTNVKYPQEAAENGIEGRVVVRFKVGTDGGITDIEFISNPSEILAEETIRVLREAPLWKPGILNGNPVKISFVLPLDFRLQ